MRLINTFINNKLLTHTHTLAHLHHCYMLNKGSATRCPDRRNIQHRTAGTPLGCPICRALRLALSSDVLKPFLVSEMHIINCLVTFGSHFSASDIKCARGCHVCRKHLQLCPSYLITLITSRFRK